MHGDVRLPAFFPDGTYGSVRCVDSDDLIGCGVPGVVMNCYHLLTKPGIGVLRHFGGARRFSGWEGPILTDSGGFQVFSLIRENPKFGEIRNNGIIFRQENGDKLILSPEKCIQAQFTCDSDIMMCLDYCTHPDDPYETVADAVDITVRWAGRCKAEYERQLAARGTRVGGKASPRGRPLLFAIIQGGAYRDLRERCAEALIAMGFDGYGFGGWPLTSEMSLMEDILEFTASLMPDDAIKYAMGIGKPDNIIKCAKMGYNLFDCVIPTRDARHNRLYVFEGENRADGGSNNGRHTIDGDANSGGGGSGGGSYGGGDSSDNGCSSDAIGSESSGIGGDVSNNELHYSTYYILDKEHIRDSRPISDICGCHTCSNYSRAYLYHLAKNGDPSAYRLATIHNLRFYADLMEKIGTYPKRRAMDNITHAY